MGPEALADQEVLIEMGVGLVDESHDLPELAKQVRHHLQESYDAAFGTLNIGVQHALGSMRYRILLGGRTIASGEVHTGRVLAVALERHVEVGLRQFGERIVVDPVFALPGCWIRPRLAAKAREAGLVTAAPAEVIALHLQEAVAQELAGA